MIDPNNPPHISTARDGELEEFLLFTAAVAGHNAKRTAKLLHDWLDYHHPGYLSPMPTLHSFYPYKNKLADDLKEHGFGCYTQRAKSFIEIFSAITIVGVRNFTFDRLIDIYGIGLKSASFFLAYTGMDENRVILDTHVLQWLKRQGWPRVPKSTPRTVGKYDELSLYFRAEAARRQMTVLDLDRQIWQGATNGS